MAKSNTERQAELREKVREGKLHRTQMYLTPAVYQALKALAGGEHGKTHTDVVSRLVMAAYKAQQAAKPKQHINIKLVTTKREYGSVYTILHRDQPIGDVSKNTDNSWSAGSLDGERFTGKTRKGAVAAFVQSLNVCA